MDLTGKKIGIWGFGVVGKSAYNFITSFTPSIGIMDRAVTRCYADDKGTWYPESDSDQFFAEHDLIIPSPGIDLRCIDAAYRAKLLSELDLFASFFKKPYIAITGTVGKTTVTTFITELLNKNGIQARAGGNIGIGMLDLIAQQDAFEYAVLEVSSFQLEHAHLFAPEIAIITNFYPNHLDRHSSHEEYFSAKCTIVRNQKSGNIIAPIALAPQLQPYLKEQQKVYWISPNESVHGLPRLSDTILHVRYDALYAKNVHHEKLLFPLGQLPATTFLDNWLTIFATLEILNVSISVSHLAQLAPPAHRIEKVATINGIHFYNDSKATTPSSTLAAIEKLSGKPIILMLGGLSKGIDRRPFIAELRGKVSRVICFGAEAYALHTWCQEKSIESEAFSDLHAAFTAAINKAGTEDQILFSPAGSSFDLFKDYQERGITFKNLVKEHEKQCGK